MKKVIALCAGIALFSFGGMAWASDITMNGSTTVLPIAQSAAEKYMGSGSGVKITVSGGGSGNGIKAIIDGTTDIANSSRFIKTEEVKAAVEKGVYPVPFAIAIDAVIPVVHPDNPVQNLTIDQLQKIYAGAVTNWKDVGGEDRPIAVVGRDTSSGTYETWEGIVLKKERVTPRALVVASSGAMITTVAKNRNAIGYDGIGYINDTVKALTVDGTAGSGETALNGKYPVARFLYMFTEGWPQGDVLKFINWMLSDEGQKIVAAAGFVPLRTLK